MPEYVCFTRLNLANHPSFLFLFGATSTDSAEIAQVRDFVTGIEFSKELGHHLIPP